MNPAVYASLPASACTLGTQGTGANDYGPDRITRLTYDAAGQILKTTVAYGIVGEQTDQETNTYTLNGKLATVTDGENNTTTFEYDGHDRLLKTRYPVATVGALASSTTDYEQLSYDANSNVVTDRRRDGQLITFTYDNLNRITFKDVPNLVTGEYDVTTVYDNFDHPTTVNDTANNFVGANYDALGRMTAQSSPSGVIGMAWDQAGRLTKVVHPDNIFFDYTYNTSDLTGIVENGTTSLISYTYDNLGRRFQASRANGAVTNYNYDPIGRLGAFKQNLVGTANDLTINGPAFGGTTIAYNPASQITVLSRSNDSYAYTGHYNVNRNYGTNGLNQLTSAGATALGYDLRGNLTSSGTDTYTYTSENRLATRSNGTTIYYDPSGRMSRLVQGLATTRFEYLGPRLVIERDGNGNVLRRYVHGPGDDEPVVWYEGAGLTNKRWLHTDERGSVIAISDATGTAIATNRYDEYGVPQTTNTGRFQYTGQEWIPELGLYYYKARMYSPTLGRFMQTDPIGYKDQINLYVYARNDPLNKVDPAGERPVDVWIFRETEGRKAGHIMITEHESEKVIVSQFPANTVAGPWSSAEPNQTLDFEDTMRSERSENGNTTVMVIDVPNDRGLDAAAQKERDKPLWDTIPQNNPSKETNCSFAAYSVLTGGGVKLLSNSPLSPAQLEKQITTQLKKGDDGIWRNRY